MGNLQDAINAIIELQKQVAINAIIITRMEYLIYGLIGGFISTALTVIFFLFRQGENITSRIDK
jgi:hypothetical protein